MHKYESFLTYESCLNIAKKLREKSLQPHIWDRVLEKYEGRFSDA